MDYSDCKILVVDDEVASQQLISALLIKEFNVKIEVVPGAKEAFLSMQTEKPDLVILDLQMPVMDGYTALVHIRSDDNLRDIPVIPCTALSHRDLIVSLYKLNIKDYILKPIIRKTFLDKIDNTLKAILIQKNLEKAKKDIKSHK